MTVSFTGKYVNFWKEARHFAPSEMRFRASLETGIRASSGMSHLSDNLWPFNRLGSPKLVAPSVDLFLMRCDVVFCLLKGLLFLSLSCCVVEALVQLKTSFKSLILGQIQEIQLNHLRLNSSILSKHCQIYLQRNVKTKENGLEEITWIIISLDFYSKSLAFCSRFAIYFNIWVLISI